MPVKTSIFISYAREDAADLAVSIRRKLVEAGVDAFLDKHSIAPGEPWENRLLKLVTQSEKILFLISPKSVESKYCVWEINQARHLGKSIIPIVVKEVEHDLIPGALKRLNFLFMRTPEEQSEHFAALQEAISVDIEWEREKKRISDLAIVWDTADRPNRLLLTSEDAIKTAETWRDMRPKDAPAPTRLQLELISKSRSQHSRRQKSILLGSFVIAVAMASAALFSWQQRNIAIEQEREAEKRGLIALSNESAALTALASSAVDELRPTIAAKLALAAWPRDGSDPRPTFGTTHRLFSKVAPMLSEQFAIHTFEDPITKSYFLGNAGRVLTFSSSGKGRLLDGLSGASIATIDGQGERVQFSQDKAYFVTVLTDNHSVGVWDAETGQQIAVLVHDVPVVSLRVNYNGSRVLTATGEKFAYLWNAKTGTVVRELKASDMEPAHKDGVFGARFTPTGNRAMTVSPTSVYLWDGASGEIVGELQNSEGVEFIHASPDGNRVLITQLDGSSPMIFDTANGRRKASLSNLVEDAAFLPDLDRLIVWRDGQVIIFNTKSGKSVARVPSQRRPFTGSVWVADIESRVVSNLGDRFLTWEADRIVRVRSMETGEVLVQTKAHLADIVRADFGNQDDHLWVQTSDNQILLWDSVSGVQRAAFSSPNGGQALEGFSVSADNQWLFTWSRDSSLRVWDISAQIPQTYVVADGMVRSAALDASKKQALVAMGDHTVLLDVATGEEISRFRTIQRRVDKAQFSPDGSRILVTEYASANALLWDSKSFAQITNLGSSDFRVKDAKFNPKRPEIFAWSSNRQGARVYSSGDGNLLESIDQNVREAVFNPQGTRLFSTDYSAPGIIFDTASWDEIATVPGYVRDGQFDKDGSSLLVFWTHREDILKYIAKIYDANTGQEKVSLEGLGNRVVGGRFTPDGNRALIWSIGGGLRLWNVSDGGLVISFEGNSHSIKDVFFSPNGEQVLSWSSDGTVRLWSLETGEQLGILYDAGFDNGTLSAPVFSEDGRHVLVEADGKVSVIETKSMVTLAEYRTDSFTSGMAVGGVGSRLLTWSTDALEIWQTRLDQPVSAFEQICSTLPNLTLDDLAAELGLGVLDPICFDPEKIPIYDGVAR